MDLSSELISQFVKATKDTTPKTSEATIYGTTVEYNGTMYVKLDGSERLTPVETTVALNPNERVTVLVKNHTATVTGNISSPAARNSDVESLAETVANVDTLIADTVDAKTANIESAIITKLDGKYATFDAIEAAEADIDILKADNVTINNKLTARDAEIDQLKANSLSVQVADAKYATIGDLEATNGKFNNLESAYGDFVDLTTDKFEAIDATIAELDVESLNAKYANIDFTNIGKAAMENFYANSGLIQNVVVGDQTITGELVGVTIRGDRIIGGSIVADKLVIKGNDGIYYKLNAEGGATPDQLATEEFKNGLHGSNIIANSITAEKIDVKDLVAFGAKIGNFNIGDNSIYSGAKSSIDNTTTGIYMGADGQMNLGNSSNHLKFYKDQNGNYKLSIAADSLTIGTGAKNVEEAINNAQTTANNAQTTANAANNVQVGGRNLVLGTSVPFERPTTADLVSYSGSKTYKLSPTILNDSKAFWLSFDKDEYLTLSFDIEFPRLKRNSALSLNRVGVYWQVTSTHTNGTTKTWYGTHSNQTGKTNKHSIPSITNSLVGYGDTESGVIGHYSVYVNVRTALSYLYDDPDNYTVVTKSNINVEQYGYTTGGYIKNVKLERGNRQTDWTPAPEDTDAAIDNIQVGGTNLLRHDSSSWAQGAWQIVSGSTPNGANNRIACTAPIPVKANESFIVSRFNTDYTLTLLYFKSDNVFISETSWLSTFPYKFTPPSGTEEIRVTVRQKDNVAFTSEKLKDEIRFKIEKGDKPTDWTPAPEDMAGTATNHLYYDSSTGLVIGDGKKVPTGNNVLIDNDSVDIRNGSTILASYGASNIKLGLNSTNSKITLCGDKGSIYVAEKDRYGGGTADALYVDSEDVTIYGDYSISSLLKCPIVSGYTTVAQAWLHLTSQSETADDGTKYYLPNVRLGMMSTMSKSGDSAYGTHTNFIEISPDLGTKLYSGSSMMGCKGSAAEMFGWQTAKMYVYETGINPYIEITRDTTDNSGYGRIYMVANSIVIDPINRTEINSNLSVSGTLGVTGNTTLSTLTTSSTATITGALTAKSTLAVTGATTLTGALTAKSTASITGDTTLGGILYMPNNKPIYMKNASGAYRQTVYIQGDNLYRFGYGGYANSEGRTDLLGNEIKFYVKYANDASYKPYYDGGDTVTVKMHGAGFISSSAGKVYFTVPLSKPVIGGCSVSISSVGGITVRYNNLYLYGSSSSTYAKPSSYTAAVDNEGTFVRIVANMPNTTNATNNTPCGIDAHVKLTFAYG